MAICYKLKYLHIAPLPNIIYPLNYWVQDFFPEEARPTEIHCWPLISASLLCHLAGHLSTIVLQI